MFECLSLQECKLHKTDFFKSSPENTFIDFFFEGEREKETSMWERNITWLVTSLMHPTQGWVCAPTRDGIGNPLAYRKTLQPTEPLGQGHKAELFALCQAHCRHIWYLLKVWMQGLQSRGQDLGILLVPIYVILGSGFTLLTLFLITYL